MAQSESGGGATSAASAAAAADSATSSEESASRSAQEESAALGGRPRPPRARRSSSRPARATGSPGSDGRDNRRVERSAAITLGVRPAQIDGVARQVSEPRRRPERLRRLLDGRLVAHGRRRHADPAGAGAATSTRRWPSSPGSGAVRDRSQRTEDITAQTVSARDRLQDARAERRSLLRQLEDATTLQAAAALRARLRDVSAEIEAARAGRPAGDQPLGVLDGRGRARRRRRRGAGRRGGRRQLGSRRRRGRRAAGARGRSPASRLVALAVLLPLALVVALLLLAARWGTRRGRERALDVA